MISSALTPDVFACLLPRPQISTVEWALQNVTMPPASKVRGGWRIDLFPWAKEVLACCDDPDYHRVTLQTAAQVGKTTLGQVFIAKSGATNPHPMAWADADERSTRRVLRRTWRLFERCNGLSHLCPPRRSQSSDHMELPTFEVHGAWTRSASSAADYGAWIVVLNETDKMVPVGTDPEADFRYLMCERAKGYVGATILEFSTPTVKGLSYIEKQRLAGDNRHLEVPCPHCNGFQELITGNGHDPGGVRFERLADGTIDAQKALETAYYQCAKCLKPIKEDDRYQMLQECVWVPEGCSIRGGRVVGKKARPGNHASFGPLSTLHSLLPGITIGEFAKELALALTAKTGKAEKLRHFTNSWKGETWDPKPQAVSEHELKARLCDPETRLRTVPEWARFLTVGVDLGEVHESQLVYWWVSAWGLGSRGCLVDYGVAGSEDEFIEQCPLWKYQHADGSLRFPVVCCVDSSFKAQQSYTLCAKLNQLAVGWGFRSPSSRWCYPVKGSSTANVNLITYSFQTTGIHKDILAARKALGLADLIIVDTNRSQEWRQSLCNGLIDTDSAEWYSLPPEACDDHEILEQLTADYPVYSQRGVAWERASANEAGDILRYSRAAAEHFATIKGRTWQKLPAVNGVFGAMPAPREQPTKGRRTVRQRSRFLTPGGRPFVARR